MIIYPGSVPQDASQNRIAGVTTFFSGMPMAKFANRCLISTPLLHVTHNFQLACSTGMSWHFAWCKSNQPSYQTRMSANVFDSAIKMMDSPHLRAQTFTVNWIFWVHFFFFFYPGAKCKMQHRRDAETSYNLLWAAPDKKYNRIALQITRQVRLVIESNIHHYIVEQRWWWLLIVSSTAVVSEPL